MKHVIMMLIGCVLPFLLIFILPALGVSNDLMLVIFIVLMLGCHLFMGHASHGRNTMSNATNTISPIRFGFAFGATCVVFRLGCILTLITVPRDKAIAFFNSLAHGIDVAPILRESIMRGEVLLGIVSTFALAWFAGAMIAAFYNLGSVVFRKET